MIKSAPRNRRLFYHRVTETQTHWETQQCVLCDSLVKPRVIAPGCATVLSRTTDEVIGEHAWTTKGGVFSAIYRRSVPRQFRRRNRRLTVETDKTPIDIELALR
jgi:hypothetical protein